MTEKIAICIPCYNEAPTITSVVESFRSELPEAEIWVIDNNSTDGTGAVAEKAGARVILENRQGKGNAIKAAFRQIEADIYVLADGDNQCPAEAVHDLIKPILFDNADLVVGDRLTGGGYDRENKRAFHSFGNRLVLSLINGLYGVRLTDILSGYRACNRLFAKGYPILSKGYEIETEMSIHAVANGFRLQQVPFNVRDRPEIAGQSKVSTFSDGLLVLSSVALLFMDLKPLRFFSAISFLLLIAGIAVGIPVIRQSLLVNEVSLYGSALLAVGFVVLAMLFFISGLILHIMRRKEQKNYELFLSLISNRLGR
ncbi:glycosyl transferase [Gordonibacter sp. 28C]|uniref:glycosyltransferase family 2 protein n=1 Tax=Gordonibacter sp. 28C TaxID=2078569 RepID=UPI000DF843FF|nr:glycosyltransferase family 2 protein [Gordonibacter sp. 28C]RDB58984.1 glycosyl transferase [Gordonibacter sp. 28C]